MTRFLAGLVVGALLVVLARQERRDWQPDPGYVAWLRDNVEPDYV